MSKGKEIMAKQKKQEEDGRDIWDKVLDNAPLIGAVGGGILGRANARRIARKASVKKPKFMSPSGSFGTVEGALTGAAAGAATREFYPRDRRK